MLLAECPEAWDADRMFPTLTVEVAYFEADAPVPPPYYPGPPPNGMVLELLRLEPIAEAFYKSDDCMSFDSCFICE